MKTFSAKANEIKREWLLVDANGKTLGRLATEIAKRLRGKHKAEYTPHIDVGDYVIVVNAEKIALTGNKRKGKIYHRHTGYIGGIKSVPLSKVLASHPERIIESAVKGMLPRNPLGRSLHRKLKVYACDKHPHEAQQPRTLNI